MAWFAGSRFERTIRFSFQSAQFDVGRILFAFFFFIVKCSIGKRDNLVDVWCVRRHYANCVSDSRFCTFPFIQLCSADDDMSRTATMASKENCHESHATNDKRNAIHWMLKLSKMNSFRIPFPSARLTCHFDDEMHVQWQWRVRHTCATRAKVPPK